MRKATGTIALLLLAATPLFAGEPADTRPVLDPMQPTWLRGSDQATRSAPRRERFTVDSIVVSPERRIAVINGSSLAVGESINGAKVIRIDPDAVTLERDGSRFTIVLAINDIKKATRNGG